jgi:hypothetical protein
MPAALAAAALTAVAAQAPEIPVPDPPGTVLTRVAAPTHVAARDGLAVFGAADLATGSTVLMRRDATGTIAPVGTPPLPAPPFPSDRYLGEASPPAFEVTLGTGPGGRLTAVHLRCTGASRSSCGLVAADVTAGTEQAVPGTARALRGAIRGSRIVFVRRDLDGVQRLYSTGVTGGAVVRLALPRLTEYTGRRPSPGRSVRRIDRRQARIAAVDVRGDRVAYVVNFPVMPAIAESQLWVNRGPRAPRLVARIGTGGASAGFRELVGPRLERQSVVLYRQGRDQGSAVQRWSLGGRRLGSVALWPERLDIEVTGGGYDRGHFLYGTNPYQGNGCAPIDAAPEQGSCPVVDSGRLTLARPG